MYKNLKVGIALGGGAARGLAHIGVIKELEKTDIEIDALCGTSVGAIVGGYYCAVPSAEELEESISRFVKSTEFRSKKMKFLRQNFPDREDSFFEKMTAFFTKGVYLGTSFFSSSFVSRDDFRHNINSILPDRNIEELSLDFSAVAADLKKAEEKVFTSGSLRQSVMASSAIPGIFPPVEIGDSKFVDGGWVNLVPISALLNRDLDFTVAVNVSYDSYFDENPDRGIDIIAKSSRIKNRSFARMCAQKADFTIDIHVNDVDWADFDRIESIVKRGRETFKQNKKELLEALNKRRRKKWIPFRKTLIDLLN